MAKSPAYLIEILDDEDIFRYVFTDPEWAEWIDSDRPPLARRDSVRLDQDNVPQSLYVMAVNRGVELGSLTSGTYRDDKILVVSEVADRLDSLADLANYDIQGEFATMYY